MARQRNVPPSRERIRELLGDIDDLVAAQIVATGASEATLMKALDHVEHDIELGEASAEPQREPGFAEVYQLLVELLPDDELAYVDYATD